MLKKMGLLSNEAMRMPGDESSPHPPSGFQKRSFYLRRNNSKNAIYNIGGVCICVCPKVGYFDVKFADFVQGWCRKCLYVKDESSDAQEADEEEEPEAHGPANTSTSNMWSFLRIVMLHQKRRLPRNMIQKYRLRCLAPEHRSQRRLKPGQLANRSLLPGPLMKELVNLGSFIGFRDEVATLREAMHRAKERADDLEAKLKASKESHKRAEKDAADVKDLRRRLQAAENALSGKEAKQVERENDIITRLETQSQRFSNRGHHEAPPLPPLPPGPSCEDVPCRNAPPSARAASRNIDSPHHDLSCQEIVCASGNAHANHERRKEHLDHHGKGATEAERGGRAEGDEVYNTGFLYLTDEMCYVTWPDKFRPDLPPH
ncbi:hypothetical protein QYE76_054797 [Lolium multiflorum]|uniref:Uncharacterized protein n=1 Tax=Lolium multiflorum TaxID=4521 RepID=A0AAD8WNB2_LOLMU|nr:hypothetical protein QYE76_054797 [Lolium multiflorum]